MVLVDLGDLLPMGQHTAQDLSHRPLQSRPHMGERDSGGGLRTDTVLQDRRQPRRGRHDLHGQFADDGAGGLLRTARLQRWQCRFWPVHREREQSGFGQTRALAQGR